MMDINELLFIGTNKYGQAGIGQKHHNKIFQTPKSFAFPIFIKQISCGSHHSALLTIDGNIYTMGSNIHGALGSNPSLNYSFTPTIVQGLSQVTKINCGPFHMCAISDGALYSWGKGIDGQLGHGNTKNMPKPTLVQSLGNEVEDVSCGTNHTIVSIRKQNRSICYSFGNGIYGQLGTGQSRNSYTPIRVKLESVEAFAAGDNHSLFILDGKVYGCGDNSSGQLGALFSKKFSSEPMKAQLPEQQNFISVYAKKYSIALTDRGQMYIWGLKPDFGIPKKLKGSCTSTSQMIQARVGSDKCFSLQSKGILYEWDIMKGKEIEGSWLCNNKKLVENNRAILDFSAGQGYILILGDIVRQIQYNSTAAHNLSCYEDLQSINNSLRIDQISLLRDKQSNSQVNNDHLSKDSSSYDKLKPQCLINPQEKVFQNIGIKRRGSLQHAPRKQQLKTQSEGLKERRNFNNIPSNYQYQNEKGKGKHNNFVLNSIQSPSPDNISYPLVQHDTFDLMQSQSSSIQCQPTNFLKESIKRNIQSDNRQILITDSILQSQASNINPIEIMMAKQQRRINLVQQKENIMTANFQKKGKLKRIDRVMQMLEKSHSISQKTIVGSDLREDPSQPTESRTKENQIIKSNRLLRVQLREKELKISQLQELLSRKQMEIEAQREVIKLLREKNQSQFVSLERN